MLWQSDICKLFNSELFIIARNKKQCTCLPIGDGLYKLQHIQIHSCFNCPFISISSPTQKIPQVNPSVILISLIFPGFSSSQSSLHTYVIDNVYVCFVLLFWSFLVCFLHYFMKKKAAASCSHIPPLEDNIG